METSSNTGNTPDFTKVDEPIPLINNGKGEQPQTDVIDEII